ncbi:MAG TPA: acylneuraminate cytidylyltransferase family protein [Saccharofermentans sp.]|nr:acylneuraminate cytidylyltransferase family protein [Saccharofermentans sp.]
MYDKRKIVAMVPARGGSKGIPGKNLIEVAGKPLIYHVLGALVEAAYVDEIYVCSDSFEILDKSEEFHWKVRGMSRPPEVSTDKASTESVMKYFLGRKPDTDILLTVQCTSPLTETQDFNEAIKMFCENDYDSMLTVTADRGGFLCGGFRWTTDKRGKLIPADYEPTKRPRRQDFPEYLRENGAFYLTTRKCFEENECRLGGKVGYWKMPGSRSFEIDEPADVKMLNAIFRGLKTT